jgi:hypothetical protein
LLAILPLLCASRTAFASGELLPLDLTWDAPERCPDASVVRRRIEQILLAPPPPTIVVATAKVRATEAHRFALTLTVRTGDVEETRNVDAAACSALADATAVVIALAIDPSLRGGADSEAPTAPPPAPKEPAPPPRTPRPPPPSPGPAKKSLRPAAGLGVVVEPGTLPKVGWGLELTAGVRLDRLRLGVRGAVWQRQQPVFDDQTGAGASFAMVQLGAFGGYLIPVHRFAFGPCTGLEASLVRVHGFGIRSPRSTWTSWPTLALGARGEARLSHFLGLFARADLVVPVDAPTFTLGTSGSGVALHDPASPVPRFTIGAEVFLR